MRSLLVGPKPEPVTGQALAFSMYLTNTKHHCDVVDTNFELFSPARKLWLTLCVFFKVTAKLFKPIDVVYLTISRSKFGSVKDIYIILLTKILFKKRVVVHLHGADFETFIDQSSGLFLWCLDHAYRRVDKAVVLSVGMCEQFRRYPNIQVVVVPNCYEVFICSRVGLAGNKLKPLKLIYLSNLMATKGLVELVEAVTLVNKDRRVVELEIAGRYFSDELMTGEQLENKIVSLLKNGIAYIGAISGREKLNFLQDADVLLLPSYYKSEAQPLCIIEAMAAGTYIITTNHNYMRDFVSEKNGALVNTRDTAAIVAAILDVVSDREKLERVKAYNETYAQNNFSLANYVDSLDRILED